MQASLTRRGRVLVAAVVVGALLGWLFGGRALNAIVMPGVALLAVGLVYVSRVGEPTLSRRVPATGTTGDTVRVHLDVDAPSPTTVTVTDELPDGVDGDPVFETTVDSTTLSYALRLSSRGVHEIGPARVRVADLFGLWERQFFYGDSDAVTAFPRVHPLYESAGLLQGYVGLSDEREQFDGLREYRHGDALRDINWKLSAKRSGELLVTEYAGEGASRQVTVAVDPAGARVDSAAEAAASVAVHLLDAGLAVGLVTPTTRLGAAGGDEQRRHVLTALARLERGELGSSRAEDADILVRAPPDGSHVGIRVDGGMQRFGELVAARSGSDVSAEVSA